MILIKYQLCLRYLTNFCRIITYWIEQHKNVFTWYLAYPLAMPTLPLLFSGVTILLALTVFHNILTETLPQVSDAMPLLGTEYSEFYNSVFGWDYFQNILFKLFKVMCGRRLILSAPYIYLLTSYITNKLRVL